MHSYATPVLKIHVILTVDALENNTAVSLNLIKKQC